VFHQWLKNSFMLPAFGGMTILYLAGRVAAAFRFESLAFSASWNPLQPPSAFRFPVLPSASKFDQFTVH
jgi:hypothetical protein